LRLVDARALNASEFAAALEFQQARDRIRDPGFPVTPAAELQALFDDNATDYAHHQRVVAFDGESAVAMGGIELTVDPANATVASVGVKPAGAHGSDEVLAELLQRARADDRSLIIAGGDYSDEANEFWTGLGARLSYIEQESRLDMASVDAALMQDWINAAPQGYRLLYWSRSCPDDWIGVLVDTCNAMNDAPRDDLDFADMYVDAEMMRGEIKARNARGLEFRGILAVDDEGSAAGSTEVFVNRHRPECSWQWTTVVLRAHRGRRIGRWMKAAMWQWLRASEPAVTHIETGNAASNSHMLAINTEMGYQPTHKMACWQAPISTLESSLNFHASN